ncbi:MAG: HD domain-containing protein [Bacteroidota bacterium]
MSSVAQEIVSLFRRYGTLVYGEACSVLSHSFQAGELAQQQGLDEELVLAAFLHDIGHLCPLEGEQAYQQMAGFGIEAHDEWGARFLEGRGFSPRLVATVRNHVQAKRYLCFSDPAYYSTLSKASRETLVHQGGVFSAAEAQTFENSPYFRASITIRKIDELAKGINVKILPIHWELLNQLITKHLAQ